MDWPRSSSSAGPADQLGPAHRLALAGGVADLRLAFLPHTPVLGSAGTVNLAGNIVFTIAAVVLLTVACRTVRGPEAKDLDGLQSLTHAPPALEILV